MTPSRWAWATVAILGGSVRLYGGEVATAVATVSAGLVAAITVVSGGSGYLTAPSVTLDGGGGTGATAMALLAGDTVDRVLVLSAGSGYSSAPSVTMEPPPEPVGVLLELVPKLTVVGPAGTTARVESALALGGPWESWTNVLIGAGGTVVVDLRPGSAARFYRAVAGVPSGPDGFPWIPPGTFVIGSPTSETGRDSDEVQHSVTLTQGFWMSDHEVTQAEYQSVMEGNPSYFKGDPDRPVETVSWGDAMLYCQRLTERQRGAGRMTSQQEYRLPTEAEWEYAARAGAVGARHGELDDIAWHGGNSGVQTHRVRLKTPNAWGLYDMLGNVREWCLDWSDDYAREAVVDPTGPILGVSRVIRGGGWNVGEEDCRSADRYWYAPGNRNFDLGFRVILARIR